MREHPILFSAPMVQAILAGTKTQTRRVVKFDITGPNPPSPNDYYDWYKGGKWQGAHRTSTPFHKSNAALLCPYGQVSDQLWVRETHAIVPRTAYAQSEGVHQVDRYDDNHDAAIFRAGWELSQGGIKWRPSIHMPRWASRIQLEITGVSVERLQDISEADCIAEGVGAHRDMLLELFKRKDMSMKSAYCNLWESINGAGSWSANPFVWVIEFKRV